MKISVGQGLLLLIDHYDSDEIKNKTKVEQLKKLYLCGSESENDAQEIIELLKDPILSEYEVSHDSQTINADPTRRYFETHLAYESLKNGLHKIDKRELEKHFHLLKNRLDVSLWFKIDHVLNGKFNEADSDGHKEYTDYIDKIKSGRMFGELSSQDREKIELLVKCSFLGVINAMHTRLPLNIYSTGIFQESNRGKVLLADQKTTLNQNLGLMKGHMPLARNDIAHSDKIFPYLKPSDQASFVENAQWVKLNFAKLVHPFSNSISGTMLCQLRCHAQLRNEDWGIFTASAEKLSQYTQLLISAMLFNSGGHSLNEFTALLSLDAVREEFRSTKGFEKISLASMYFTNNKEGFNQALEDTISYNKVILLSEKLHEEIRKNEFQLKEIAPISPSHSEKKVHPDLIKKFNKLSPDLTKEMAEYDQRVKNQWSSSFRAGRTKNILIQSGLELVKAHMYGGDLIKANQEISQLKESLTTKFGKKNFWGQPSESFKLVESVETRLKNIQLSINKIQHSTVSFKEDLKSIKESNKQEINEPSADVPRQI